MAEVIDAEIIDLESDSDGDDPPPPTVKPTVKHCPRCTLENAIGAKRCEACDLAFERPAPAPPRTRPAPAPLDALQGLGSNTRDSLRDFRPPAPKPARAASEDDFVRGYEPAAKRAAVAPRPSAFAYHDDAAAPAFVPLKPSARARGLQQRAKEEKRVSEIDRWKFGGDDSDDDWCTPRRPAAPEPRKPRAAAKQGTLSTWLQTDPPAAPPARVERVDVASMPGATVLRGALGSEVRSWSKIFVPLIYCALGDVPPLAARRVEGLLSTRQRASTPDDVARAAAWWAERLSPWPAWVAAIRGAALEDRDAFVVRVLGDCRGKTACVFGDGAGYGWLPHPPARQQERVMRDAGIDGEIAACVLTATAKP